VYDASTKIPSALITGNIWQMGGFDECIDIAHETHSNLGKLTGNNLDEECRDEEIIGRAPFFRDYSRTTLLSLCSPQGPWKH